MKVDLATVVDLNSLIGVEYEIFTKGNLIRTDSSETFIWTLVVGRQVESLLWVPEMFSIFV